MQPAGGGTNMLGNRRGEGDHVVLGDLLDFFDPGDVESAALANVARGVGRHDPRTGHRVDRGNLDLQPGLVFPLVAPDATHFGVRVPRDHLNGIISMDEWSQPSASLSRGNSRPLTAPSTVAASEPLANRSFATRCTSAVVTRSTPSSVSSRPN